MEINEFLTQFENSNPRYRCLAFSGHSVNSIDEIKNQLLQQLSPIEIWIAPSLNKAPPSPISRIDWCYKVFTEPHPEGLLILSPEDWMFEWTEADQRHFWVTLSQAFGDKKGVFVIFKETPTITMLVTQLFDQRHLTGNRSAWTSKREN
jgi:hypothetical protein